MIGRFGDDGRGGFTCDDTYDSVPIRVNYIWSEITAQSCRWEKEFSADGGATWETNWTAEFTRTSNCQDLWIKYEVPLTP